MFCSIKANAHTITYVSTGWDHTSPHPAKQILLILTSNFFSYLSIKTTSFCNRWQRDFGQKMLTMVFWSWSLSLARAWARWLTDFIPKKRKHIINRGVMLRQIHVVVADQCNSTTKEQFKKPQCLTMTDNIIVPKFASKWEIELSLLLLFCSWMFWWIYSVKEQRLSILSGQNGD